MRKQFTIYLKNIPFITWFIITLIGMFTLGLIIGMIIGVAPNALGIAWWAIKVTLKCIGTWLTFNALATVVARNLLGTTLRDLFLQMHDKVALQENLSPVAVTVGLLLAVTQMFSLKAATPELYVYDVLIKGSLGLFLGLLAAMFVAWSNGVVSFEHFGELFNKKDNNQLVIFVMVVFNVAVHFAMTT